MTFFAAVALAYALSAGISVAFGAETWSASSGSYTSTSSSAPREYSYQNNGGVQTWTFDTPGGGHSATTYRPAGTPSHGNSVYDNSGTGATARTNVNVPYAPGKTGTASLNNAIPASAIGKAGAALAKALGPASLALAAYEVYQALEDDGYGPLPGDPDTWGVLEPPMAPDPNVATQTFTAYGTTREEADAIVCAGMAACQRWWTGYGTSVGSSNCHVRKHTPTGYTVCRSDDPSGWGSDYQYLGLRTAFWDHGTCPEGTSYSSSTPAGCWSSGGSRPLVPAEEDAMEAAIVDGCPGGCGFGPMVPPILNHNIPIDDPGPVWLTIPDGGLWAGDTATTTHPDGTQTVTETDYNASPGTGGEVSVTKTTTVTEKDALGNVTSVTTTEGSVNEQNAAEVPGLCEQFPDIIACMTPGTIAAAEPVEEETITVSLTPETVPGGVGSCPADIPLSIGGQSFALSWSSVCQFATGVNPIVIALGWIAAGYLLFGSVRGRA